MAPAPLSSPLYVSLSLPKLCHALRPLLFYILLLSHSSPPPDHHCPYFGYTFSSPPTRTLFGSPLCCTWSRHFSCGHLAMNFSLIRSLWNTPCHRFDIMRLVVGFYSFVSPFRISYFLFSFFLFSRLLCYYSCSPSLHTRTLGSDHRFLLPIYRCRVCTSSLSL